MASWVRSPEELAGFLGGTENWPLSGEALLDAIEKPEVTAWTAVATSAPEPVLGHIERVKVSEQEARLVRVILAPSARGKGLARELVEAAIAELENDGFARASLFVVPGNDAAERAYRASGFAEEPSPHPVWKRMTRALAPR
ncbi:hypothetical protein GCM10022288_01400 [Gryllotalpicola kribbensis]|uniref:N-acetyltransferase domain-containing protein n=1 Tax=Gryllotalpicola kribbensis TaxID=993084 RepID=A0ABP8AEV7_9MICO